MLPIRTALRGITTGHRHRRISPGVAHLALIVVLALGPAATAQPLRWRPVGPRPTTGGQVEGMADGEVDGAIRALAPHPTDPKVIYVGAVNGGIWKTQDGHLARPHWTPLTENLTSLSIGALEFDPTDASARTLVAGTGQFTNFFDPGTPRGSVLRTTDAGATWAVLGVSDLDTVNVTGVAARGAFLLATGFSLTDATRQGLWRSTNTGAGWSKISGGTGSGLPAGVAFDLAGDPRHPDRFYTAINTGSAATAGVYRSEDPGDPGKTWTRVGTQAMHDLIAGSTNVRISVGSSDNVYVVVVGSGQLAGVFRSGNGTDGWASMGLPGTVEQGVFRGIHPGGQGDTNMSLVADPVDPNLVYVGGDRQPILNSSIGSQDWSGRLFRGRFAAAGSSWFHLTHGQNLGIAGGGTAGNSAPHADSRDMAFNASGELLESDDGGVFLRTSPRTNAGDWASRNGDLQVTEFHAIAWDPISHIAIGGAQDTGSPEDRMRNDPRWQSVGTGDGGPVAVAKDSTLGRSARYSSAQFLGRRRNNQGQFVTPCSLRRFIYDATNTRVTSPVVQLLTGTTSPELIPQFYTPIKVNAGDPRRLIVGAQNGVYESTDSGVTASLIGGMPINANAGCPIAAGAPGDAEILYVGAGTRVFVRTAVSQVLAAPANLGSVVQSVVLDPDTPATAFVATTRAVFRTGNSGGNWDDITGNLPAQSPGTLRSITFAARGAGDLVVVGTDAGVFSTPAAALAAPMPAAAVWSRLGDDLPRVPVMQIEFDATDDLILAGTLGRGAWTLPFGAMPPAPPSGSPPPATPSVKSRQTPPSAVKSPKDSGARP